MLLTGLFKTLNSIYKAILPSIFQDKYGGGMNNFINEEMEENWMNYFINEEIADDDVDNFINEEIADDDKDNFNYGLMSDDDILINNMHFKIGYTYEPPKLNKINKFGLAFPFM